MKNTRRLVGTALIAIPLLSILVAILIIAGGELAMMILVGLIFAGMIGLGGYLVSDQ